MSCGDDNTIKVDRDSADVFPRRVLLLGIGDVGFGSPPTLALCLPSECDLGMCINVADLFSSGKYTGTCVSVPPVTV